MNLMKMARATVMGVMVGMAAFGLSAGQSEGQAKKVLAQGRAIYMSYCASCHGVEATGQGLVAPALKKQPSDLTRIPKERGRFPAEKVRAIIIGEPVLPVHGDKEMPVWGGILKEAELSSLLKYIESIQRPIELPARRPIGASGEPLDKKEN